MIEEAKRWGLHLSKHQKHHKTIDGYRQTRIVNLIKKHGDGIVDDFNRVKTDYSIDLTTLGERYGFSREYARLCFLLLHGQPYSVFSKEKTKKAREETACLHDPRRKVADFQPGLIKDGAEIELLFMEECIKRGFSVDIPCTRNFDLIVNGFKIEVKMRRNPNYAGTGFQLYYRLNLSEKQKNLCDFVVGYLVPEKCFYVIPINAIKGTDVYIPVVVAKRRGWKSKYAQYKDAFRLLEN